MNVEQLKKELEKRNLQTEGRKNVLMERLLADIIKAEESDDDDDGSYELCSEVMFSGDYEGRNHPDNKERRQMQNKDGGEYKYRLMSKDVEDLLPDYNPSSKLSLDAERWARTVEERVSYHRIDEKLLMLAIGKKMLGTAKLWYDGIDIQASTSWCTFRDEFVSEFRVECSEVLIHQKLRNTIRRRDQDFVEYFYVMKNIAQGSVAEESLVKYIICGLNDVKLIDSLKFLPIKTIASLKERVDTYETYNKLIPNKSKEEPNFGTSSADHRMKFNNSMQQRMKECFNCFEKGHFSRECSKPQRRPRCEICNKAGHGAEQCYSKRNNLQRNVMCVCNNDEGYYKYDGVPKQISVDENGVTEAIIVSNGGANKRDVLLDTGSAVSLFRIASLGLLANFCKCKTYNNISGVNNSLVSVLGETMAGVIIAGNYFYVRLLIVPDTTISTDILGRDFLTKNGIQLVHIKPNYLTDQKMKARKREEKNYDSDVQEWLGSFNCMAVNEKENIELDIGDDKNTLNFKTKIIDLFKQCYVDREKTEKPLITHCVSIKLKENKVFSCNPKRLSQFERIELNQIIKDYLEQGIIRESESNYSCKVVLTKKKNNTYRMCVNFRPLNKIVERDHFPLPVIEDQVQLLYGKKFFSTLDLKNGFYHVDVEES